MLAIIEGVFVALQCRSQCRSQVRSQWWSARLSGLTAIIAGVLSLHVPALAQVTTREAAEDVRGETRQQVTRATNTRNMVEQAQTMPAVGYNEVMSAPDDPSLNLRYVKDLIAKGNVQLAAATTERILLQYPEADDVRLLYAVLLYRMDVLDEASVQLDILEAHKPPPGIQAEVTRYRSAIEQRLKPLKRSAAVSLGMHFDSNRNTFPDNGKVLVGDNPFVIPSKEIDDWGRLAIGTVQIAKDTDGQNFQQIFGDMAVLYDDQVEVDALDVNALLVNAGFLYKTVYGDLLPRVHASWIELDSKKYSRDYGISLRGQRPVFKSKIKAFAQITTGWRRYNNTSNLPFSSEQDGHYQRVEIGGDRQLNATTGFRLTGAFNSVDADLAYEGYDGFDIAAAVTKVLPRGTFLLASVSFEKQYYDGNDPFISGKTREDRDWELDLTYGVPVGTIIGLVGENPAGPAPLRQIVLNLTASYEDSHSNLPNYQYDNYRGQFMFNRSWDF
jgi:hypothetical protein